jgi:imidazolonepropionase-like amidohydrolase
MKLTIRLGASCVAVALGLGLSARADAPPVYAIKGARLVTVAGAPVATGTIVLRNGLIDGVGADVQPPPDAVIVDGAGMTVYPGLIDMGTTVGSDIQTGNQPQAQPQGQGPPAAAPTFDEAERAKRAATLRPQIMAAEHVRIDSPELSRFAGAGVTTVLETPPGVLIKGHSALVSVTTPSMAPIVGAIADPRAGLSVIRTPVALHVEFQAARGQGYPEALLGGIAFVRQSFIDAQYQQAVEQRYQKSPAGLLRPPADPALDAMQAALGGRVPVAFEGNLQREVLRALAMAKEFKLSAIVTGGHEADLAAADLKAASAKVIVSMNYPTRPRTLAPDADEPIRDLRLRAHAPKVAGELAKAGIPFAFSSSGLQNETDLVKNVARAVKEGLPADAALRALTIEAARLAGAANRVGSLEKGKIANVVVTDGDLFAEKTKIKHVFVDGRMVNLDAAEPPAGRGGRGRGGD